VTWKVSRWRARDGIGKGPTKSPIQWVRGALSLVVKRPGREADHSPPSNAEVKNAWSCTSTPQYVFMAWCSVKTQGKFYLYLMRATWNVSRWHA
jgi:hypothetical protein